MANGTFNIATHDVERALKSIERAFAEHAAKAYGGTVAAPIAPPDPLTLRAESILADMLSTGGVTREQCWPEALRKAERLIEEERRGR